jgi:hypothetical protein
VAVGAGGAVEVLWAAREPSGWVVRGAVRGGAGGAWRATPALTLDPDAGAPSIGLSADGGAVAAWGPRAGAGAVRAASRPPGGAWAAPVVLDATGGAPSAAVTAGGSTAVSWTGGAGAPVVRVASGTSAAGTFGAPEDVAPGAGGGVAASAGGVLAVSWTPPAGGLAALVRRPGAPGAPQVLAGPGSPAEGFPAAVAAGGGGRAAVTWIDAEGPGTATAGMAAAAPGVAWRTARQPVGEDVPVPAAAVGPDGAVLVLTAAVGRSGSGRTVLAASFDGTPRPRLAGAVAGRRLGGRLVAWTMTVRNPSRVRAVGVRVRVAFCCGARPAGALPAGAVRSGRVLTVPLGDVPAGRRRVVRVHALLGPAARPAAPSVEVRAVAVPPARLPVTRVPS